LRREKKGKKLVGILDDRTKGNGSGTSWIRDRRRYNVRTRDGKPARRGLKKNRIEGAKERSGKLHIGRKEVDGGK